MIRNYVAIAFRNLLRHKLFSALNITSLAIGMAAFFLIAQYVRFEFSYDTFHRNANRIYRVTNMRVHADGHINHQATNHPAAGPALKDEFPEIENYARFVHQSIFMGNETPWSYTDSSGDTRIFNEEKVYDADPSFLTMFSFPFLFGSPEHALDNGSSVVISENISRKFFGNENPVGKVLNLGQRPFTVTGLVRIPENSHIRFDILISSYLRSMGPDQDGSWKFAEFYTYIELKDNVDLKEFQAKLPAFEQRHLDERTGNMNIEERFILQPVTDIHLRSPTLTKEQEVHGQESTVYFLMAVAILILIIAWINYINLSAAKALQRAGEVGIRKVAGASKGDLTIQFLYESLLVNFLAIGLSVLIVSLALPWFNRISGKNMGNSLNELGVLSDPAFWLALFGILIVGSFASGIYPAIVLTSFRIADVIKGKFFGSRSGIFLRKVLVGCQFAISIVLIAGTLTVWRQVSFMRNQDPGYAREQLLVVRSPRSGDASYFTKLNTFKTEVKLNPLIQGLAPTTEIPGKLISQQNFIRKSSEGVEGNVLSYHFRIDHEFVPTYGLDILAGRNFREGEYLPWPTKIDGNSTVMLNEQAVRALGYKDAAEAVNQVIYFGLGVDDVPAEIVGVVENHHQRSLKEGFDPVIYFPMRNFTGQYFTFRIDVQNVQQTIAFIKDKYLHLFPGNQFEYFFLDDFFDRQYAADRHFGEIFGLFTVLALFVACLGLFGLSTFMISQRTREIALRKILGATIPSMVSLFSKDFVKLIFVANLVTLPLVYFMVDRWLSSFAFRINIGWITFVLPAVVLLLLSLITVGVQTARTGSANPVKSLRSE
jgi:putative ABC transport system permease protein